jgi:hypothetical protein
MKSTQQFVLIFAHPRSGSTTLAKVLNQHPQMNIIEEPFAKHTIQNVAELEESLDALVHEPWLATGIKHVYNFVWPFTAGQADECNQHLLVHPGSLIIFLWRRNLFEAILSNLIARQLQAWDVTKGKQLLRDRPTLSPVPVRSFQACYRQLFGKITSYRDFLISNHRPFLELTYEDLYGVNISPTQQLEKVNEILFAAGYTAIQDRAKVASVQQLLAKDNKVNSQATYELIPNYMELQQAWSELPGAAP